MVILEAQKVFPCREKVLEARQKFQEAKKIPISTKENSKNLERNFGSPNQIYTISILPKPSHSILPKYSKSSVKFSITKPGVILRLEKILKFWKNSLNVGKILKLPKTNFKSSNKFSKLLKTI